MTKGQLTEILTILDDIETGIVQLKVEFQQGVHNSLSSITRKID